MRRGISKLVNDGIMNLMLGPRGLSVPFHVLYVDDVMIFCRGKQRNLQALLSLFQKYGVISGQIINPAKSIFYAWSIYARRRTSIIALLSFSFGQLPFSYLGILIFQGKPKMVYLQAIVDRVRSKLSAWKTYLLSIAGKFSWSKV